MPDRDEVLECSIEGSCRRRIEAELLLTRQPLADREHVFETLGRAKLAQRLPDRNFVLLAYGFSEHDGKLARGCGIAELTEHLGRVRRRRELLVALFRCVGQAKQRKKVWNRARRPNA